MIRRTILSVGVEATLSAQPAPEYPKDPIRFVALSYSALQDFAFPLPSEGRGQRFESSRARQPQSVRPGHKPQRLPAGRRAAHPFDHAPPPVVRSAARGAAQAAPFAAI